MTKNPHLGGDVFEHLDSIIPDTHETRLIGLIEACKLAIKEIEGGGIDLAIELLSYAISDAEKPYQSATDAMKALNRYLPPTNDE